MVQSKRFVTVMFCTAIAITSLISCGDDKNSSTDPSDTFDIVGTWDVASIEGAPPVDASNSTWTFKTDGTYDWFLLLLSFDFQGQGDYSLNGNTLTCTGFITTIWGTDTMEIVISNNNNTFSMLDGDGDRWVYNRAQ